MVEKAKPRKVVPANFDLSQAALKQGTPWFCAQEQNLKRGDIIELEASGIHMVEILNPQPPRYDCKILANFDVVNERTYNLMRTACIELHAQGINITVFYDTVTIRTSSTLLSKKFEDDRQIVANSFLKQLLEEALPSHI